MSTIAVSAILFLLGMFLGAVINEAAVAENNERKDCRRCKYRIWASSKDKFFD